MTTTDRPIVALTQPRRDPRPAPTALRISSAMLGETIAHLRAALPNEGCGLLAAAVDADGVAEARRFYPGVNADASPTRFTMEPVEVLAAFRDLEANGWRLGAIVHGHPRTPATPSPTDLAEAFYPESLMVIVSFAIEPPLPRAWRLAPRRDRFEVVEAAIEVVSAEAASAEARFLYASTPWSERAAAGRDASVAVNAADRMGAPGWTDPDERDGMPVTEVLRSREAILAELAAFPDELTRIVDRAPDPAALMRPASDGEWGVVEIIPHLRDWEVIYLERAGRIVAEEQPHLPGFDDALWSIERDYRGQDPAATLERFRALRIEHVEFLRALPPEAWSRSGEHGYYGEITLQWMEDHVCDHDREHLQQARDALAG